MKQTELVNKMTLEEKAAVLSGKSEWESRNIDRLGIPSISFADGPHGIRRQEGAGDHLGLNESLPATCFPTAATISNSWDEKLGEEIGQALGEEASALGVDVVLGPGLNIKRSPLCGRNFEYFSEDPFQAGKMAASYIRGIQSQGVYACPKHFAVNSQEQRRMVMNAVIDERTLREIYLEGFEIAIKEGGAKAVMTSYNEVNGTYANENEHLLKDILRDEWGFDGIVVTDWGGSNDHVRGTACRSNIEMPTPGFDSAREIIAAVKSGELSEAELDEAVGDLLEAVMELRGGENEQKNGYDCKPGNNSKKEYDHDAHHKLAKRAARESIVMLKNEGRAPLLPLKNGCQVALIGDFAIKPRYQGAGSSLVNAARVETMKDMIREYPLDCIGCVAGYVRGGQADEALKKEALDLAEKAEAVIFCFGLDELSDTEGVDRKHMRIPQNQIDLLEALAKVNPNIVGVLNAGSSIEMAWEGCCKSILNGYLGGQAGAGAVLDVITGKHNPSGRLSETYPFRYEDTPAFHYFPAAMRNSEYRESIFVGYRYYDTAGVMVRYPFGYGLSYTSFAYSKLKVTSEGAEFVLANTGSMDGAEVAQLYIGAPEGSVFHPEKELKGFAKVFLKAGESRTVKLPFDDKTFRYWNRETDRWEVEGGIYKIMIGASASDIRLEERLEAVGSGAPAPYKPVELEHYYSGQIQSVSDPEYEKLLDAPVPDGTWSGELSVNDAICQMYYAKSFLARFICRTITKMKEKSEAKGKPDLNILFIYNMPFRGIAKMTEGRVSMEMARGMVDAVNGHFFRGLRKVIGGYFANAKANKEYEEMLKGH